MRKNGKIEFLRFVFAVCVMIFHGDAVMTDKKARIMFSGRLGVEFFFLVSGYLMAASIRKLRHTNGLNLNIPRETEKFLLRKLKSLYPEVVFAFFLALACMAISKDWSVTELLSAVIKRIPGLLLLEQTGAVPVTPPNGTWYLSSMMIGMLVLFPLTLKYFEFMRRLGAGIIAVFSIGIMMQHTGSTAGPDKLLFGIVYHGNLRALSGLALGMLCYELAEGISRTSFTTFGRRTVGLLELGLYVICLFYMLTRKGSKYDYCIQMLLAAAVMLSFSKCNYNGKLWNQPVFGFLGKYSLYLYLCHNPMKNLLVPVLQTQNNKIRMAIFMITSLAAAGCLWLCCIGWRKTTPHVMSKFIGTSSEDH